MEKFLENPTGRVIDIYGVFYKSPDGDIEKDIPIYLAFSMEAAEAKRNHHAFHNGNFKSNYRIRRIDQQEMDDYGRILYKGNENDEGL